MIGLSGPCRCPTQLIYHFISQAASGCGHGRMRNAVLQGAFVSAEDPVVYCGGFLALAFVSAESPDPDPA